jgi:hypothetical protein
VPVEPEEDAEAHDGGDEAADQLHQPGPHQVADAVGVAHDAGDEHAGLGGVEVAHRQVHDARLDALPHVGDGPLRRHPQDLREGERRHRLDDGGGPGHQRNRQQQIAAIAADHLVDEPLRRGRQHQARGPADEHEHEADDEAAAVRPHQLARFPPRGRARDALLRCGVHPRC